MKSTDLKSQGGTGGDDGNPQISDGRVAPSEKNKCHPTKPPKTDEEVEAILGKDLPSEAEFTQLTCEIFLRLLPTLYTKEILEGEPTGHTRSRVERLFRHAEQVSEVISTSLPANRTTYGLLRCRQARTVRLFK